MATERTNVLFGPVNIFTGTAGQTAANSIGFSNGAELTVTEEVNEIETDSQNTPIHTPTVKQGVEFKFLVQEETLDNFVLFTQGATRSGGTISFGTSTDTEMSLRLVGKDPAGTARTIDIPYCRVTGGWTMGFGNGESQEFEVTIMALQNGADAAIWTISDATSSSQTLSTGVVAWVSGQKQIYVNAESGTADDMITITPGAATSSDTIVIMPAAGDTITVNETDNIALAGADTSLPLSGSDMLQVQYDGSSSWDEIARITFE
ncbi:MAG: hypothetical protein ACTSXD_08735 [Candidatus Heimdallarchaeaceae archaeon]